MSAYAERNRYVIAGASQSLAEKPGSPSLLSCGMLAEIRHRNTAAALRAPIATTSGQAARGRRHAAAPSTSTPVSAAVSAMCVALKVLAAVARLVECAVMLGRGPRSGCA